MENRLCSKSCRINCVGIQPIYIEIYLNEKKRKLENKNFNKIHHLGLLITQRAHLKQHIVWFTENAIEFQAIVCILFNVPHQINMTAYRYHKSICQSRNNCSNWFWFYFVSMCNVKVKALFPFLLCSTKYRTKKGTINNNGIV